MCSILIALTSCRPYGAELTTALELAGTNRVELEKVLGYYSGDKSDSLKLKAAEFLICNMDVHFSYRSETWDSFQKELDTLFKMEEQLQKLEQGLDELYSKYANRLSADLEFVSDLQTMRADFLIQCIDTAFARWKSPYSCHLNFEDFCEYILPYHAGKEPRTHPIIFRKKPGSRFLKTLFILWIIKVFLFYLYLRVNVDECFLELKNE